MRACCPQRTLLAFYGLLAVAFLALIAVLIVRSTLKVRMPFLIPYL
jgi:hypothetical protein